MSFFCSSKSLGCVSPNIPHHATYNVDSWHRYCPVFSTCFSSTVAYSREVMLALFIGGTPLYFCNSPFFVCKRQHTENLPFSSILVRKKSTSERTIASMYDWAMAVRADCQRKLLNLLWQPIIALVHVSQRDCLDCKSMCSSDSLSHTVSFRLIGLSFILLKSSWRLNLSD